MGKDDYFVIVYRILSYLYECFKAGEKADTELYDYDALKINQGYWCNVMESLSNEGYITGVVAVKRVGDTTGIKLNNVMITPKGIEYLQDNSMMKKAFEVFKALKNVWEVIPK